MSQKKIAVIGKPALVSNDTTTHDRVKQTELDQMLRWSRNVDQGYAWVVLFAVFFAICTTVGPYRIYSLIFARVTNEGVYTREEASWPVSMIYTVECLVGPLVSIIAYQISYRQSYLIGSLLMIFGNGLAAFSSSIWIDTLLIGAVQGIGYSFIFIPQMEIINNYFIKYRSLALGFSLSGGTLSIFVLSPIFQWLLKAYPWRCSYLGIAVFCATNLLTIPLLKPNPKPDSQLSASHNKPKAIEGCNITPDAPVGALASEENIEPNSTTLITCDPNTLSNLDSNRIFSRDTIAQLQRAENEKIPTGSDGGSITDEKTNNLQTIDLKQVESSSKFKLTTIWGILKIPAFHLIWFNELLYGWLFTIWCLILVDYGLDRGCTLDEAESLLGFQSIGELLGRLVLTAIIDMKFMSGKNFNILILSILAGLLVLVTFVEGYIWLATITISFTSFVALLYIQLNGSLIDCLGEGRVTIGFGIASFISGILTPFRPLAVGYFRDNHGSYDLLLICLAIACTLGAALWLVESLMARVVARCEAKRKAPMSSSSLELDPSQSSAF